MPAPISRAVRLPSATLALALVAAPAYANDAPFTPRFVETVRGDIGAIGNTLMTCPTGAANCDTARVGPAAGGALNNNSYTMGRIDVDADATTFDSSTATLSLPAGATVLWAGLYWAADTTAGFGGAAAPSAASRGSVKLSVHGAAYQSVDAAAADVLASTPQPNRYRAFADVTPLVAAGGQGSYTVANVQTGTGQDRFAGWALFVAYRDNAQNIRRLDVYDGLATVDSTHTFTTTIAPFHTPATGPVTTKVGLLSFEGDAGLATETATFNGNDLTDALNAANNAMNSTIEAAGTRFSAKSPDYVNQLGMDLDVFANGGALTNDQSSANLAFTSTNEYFMPSAFFLVSDEGPATSTAAPAVGGTAADGVTLTANPGTWNGTGPLSYTYQWQRCDAAGDNCVDIAGATQSTYTPGSADIGKTIRVVVTASNDAGSTTAVSAPSAIVPGAATTDLGSLPGNLAGETSCQQLVGGAKYRRVALAGIGTVRVRAYATGPARESSPVQLTTEVTGGHATSVRYAIDGRALAARGGARHAATLTPAQLGKVGGHTLRTTVRGRHGTARFATLKLTTAPCQTLFTAQRWATTAGAGLRLRVDSRTALTGLAFTVRAALLPKQTGARRTIGFLRLYVAGRRTPLRVNLALPKRGHAAVLLGAPTVTRTRRGLQVGGLPAGTAVAELTLYRVTKLDAATAVRVVAVKVTVQRAGAAAQSFSARPKATR